MNKRPPIDPKDVIQDGCPDGFWSRKNCENAARLGLCSMITIVDNRPDELRRRGA